MFAVSGRRQMSWRSASPLSIARHMRRFACSSLVSSDGAGRLGDEMNEMNEMNEMDEAGKQWAGR